MTDNVVQMQLNSVTARAVILEIIADSSRVFFTRHAEQRMVERDITRIQVFRCLEHGTFVEEPSRSANGNWQFRQEVMSAGTIVNVSAALDNDHKGNKIIVITVF